MSIKNTVADVDKKTRADLQAFFEFYELVSYFVYLHAPNEGVCRLPERSGGESDATRF